MSYEGNGTRRIPVKDADLICKYIGKARLAEKPCYDNTIRMVEPRTTNTLFYKDVLPSMFVS